MAAPGAQMKHGSIRKIKKARESPFPASESSEPGQRQCSAVSVGRERMQGKTPGGKGKLGIVPQPLQKRNRRELVFGKKIAYTVSGGVSK